MDAQFQARTLERPRTPINVVNIEYVKDQNAKTKEVKQLVQVQDQGDELSDSQTFATIMASEESSNESFCLMFGKYLLKSKRIQRNW